MGRTLLAKESCILLMLVITVGNALAQQSADSELKLVTSYTSTIQINKGVQTIDVEAAILVFANNLAGDKKFIAKVLVLREPKTGLSWWDYAEGSVEKTDAGTLARYISYYKFYLSDDVMGAVRLVSYSTVMIKEFSEKFLSFTEAKAWASKAFTEYVGKLKRRGDMLSQNVELGQLIPREFFHSEFDPSPRQYAKLESVRKEGKMTVVSLSGWNNTKVDVEINEQHQVTKLTSYPEHKAKN